jgi:hypothetical protein
VVGVVAFNVAERISSAVSAYKAGMAGSKAGMADARLARTSLVAFLTGLYPTRGEAVAALTFVSAVDLEVVLKWCYPAKAIKFDTTTHVPAESLDEVAEALKALVELFPGEQQADARKALVSAIAKAIEPAK